MDLHGDVDRVARRYLDAADAAAPRLVEGLYLVGSSVLDDYHPGASDVDFVAVTSQPLTDAERDVLAGVHREIGAAGPAFEGPYVTFDELRASPADAADGAFHHEGALTVGREGRSPVEWTTLARHGAALRGPETATLGVHTDAAASAGWTRGNLAGYWSSWLEHSRDPATPTAVALLTDWGVAWVVLGVSRLHFTPATGDITSKAGQADTPSTPFRRDGTASSPRPCGAGPTRSPHRARTRRKDATRRGNSWRSRSGPA